MIGTSPMEVEDLEREADADIRLKLLALLWDLASKNEKCQIFELSCQWIHLNLNEKELIELFVFQNCRRPPVIRAGTQIPSNWQLTVRRGAPIRVWKNKTCLPELDVSLVKRLPNIASPNYTSQTNPRGQWLIPSTSNQLLILLNPRQCSWMESLLEL